VSATLLVTKLYFPPVRPNLVPRARLVKRLQTGLQGPLTLIAAPAGYGKTTLLGEWRANAGTPPLVAWLSLDAGDNDPVRFLLYLTAAIDQVHANLTKNTRLLLQSPELPAIEVIGTTLLNELSAFSGDLILALDDYHIITAPEIHAVLAFVLEHLPPHIHLAILTRADPPLPLARLRARGQLVEIRAADLRFTTQEAAAFLEQVMGLSLTDREIEALEARTEGWIAGLQLAALSMQGRDDREHFISAFSGSHQYIVDYLAEEVLNRQPGFVREFLLKTSVLERLTGTLCDALTGRADGQATLEMLAQANLFLMPLDDERCWFRYHHLFADLLRNRLRLNLPEQVVELHRRAAAWYYQQDLTSEAIPHALAAQDFQFVVEVINNNWLKLARQYRLNVVVQWIESLPEPILGNHPRLSAVHAYALWSLGLRAAAAEHLQRAQQVLEGKVAAGQMQTADPEYLTLQTEIKAFWSLLASHAGELDTALGLARSALASTPGTAPFACAVASTSLYVAQRNNLDMEQAITSCRQAIA
jgi:LuxR family maltose regulon positive regulatory protein